MEEDLEFTTDALAIANASLPNKAQVPNHSPEFIAEGVEAEVKLTDSSEVIITFLHEGAGLKSSLGYYTYDLNNPPQSPAEINQHIILYPNTSYNNSGGGLSRGEQVNLGVFPGNTGIGFFLVPNGWNPSSQLVVNRQNNYNQNIKYTNAAFNTFAPEGQRSHTVLLNDTDRELLFLGMEDISRPNGDRDFNDAVFVVQTSKYISVDKTNMADAKNDAPDADADGIPDAYDEFPSDVEIAFTSYAPNALDQGTLMFEDQWPKLGDFDLNDMVIGYNYEYELNGSRRVKYINATFLVNAQGGAFKNGFGIELDVPPSAITSVTGTQLSEGMISLSANGTESGQSKAVIIVFDNGKSLVGNPSAGIINTDPAESYLDPVELNIRISLNTPLEKEDLGIAPYNPFIFTDLRRGYEVHLADHPPTDLADPSLFGTIDDDSDLVSGTKYYKNAYNVMWALHVPIDIEHPKERVPIFETYTRLKNWIGSGGTSYTDWYSNTAYQNPGSLYTP